MDAADLHHPFDRPTADDLRARGSLKWTAYDADIAAWVAEADFGTAPAVTAALLGAVRSGAFGYLPPAVRQDLADSCATWHRDRYGWQVDPELVHPVGDVLEALGIAVAHFSRPGSPLIVPTPAYMPFLTAPRVWGREILQVPQTQDGAAQRGPAGMDLAALDAAFAAGGHLLVLTNPHNPTGRVSTRPELLAVAEVVERHGGRVFADEIHAPLVYEPGRHVPYASLSPATAAHTVTSTSASKAFNVPGLKCAQVILSNDADAETWQPMDAVLTKGASLLGALATTVAYREGGPWLAEVVDHLDGNRAALATSLSAHAPAVVHESPEGTYLAWLDLRGTFGSAAGGLPLPRDLARWLRERTGVAVLDGALCGEQGRGFVRLNFAMPRPMVVEAGRRIGACLDSLVS